MAEFTREEILAKVAAKESLKGADLRGADLRFANLRDADLSYANLGGAKLSGAKSNETTIWPDDFDQETAGAVLVKDDD